MKFKSPLISQASGSVGGATYSHNRGGMYIRNRTIPTNPASQFQVAIRNFVTALTSGWLSLLTAVQRAGWDNYADLVHLPDSLGDPRNVGGLGMYVRSNVPRLQAGLPQVNDAPTIYNLGEFTTPAITSITASTSVMILTFDNTDEWANEDDAGLLILGSRGQNESINFFKGPYRYADKIEGDAITPPTSPANVTIPFPLAVDQKVFCQFRVTREDGRLSGLFRLGALCI